MFKFRTFLALALVTTTAQAGASKSEKSRAPSSDLVEKGTIEMLAVLDRAERGISTFRIPGGLNRHICSDVGDRAEQGIIAMVSAAAMTGTPVELLLKAEDHDSSQKQFEDVYKCVRGVQFWSKSYRRAGER